MLRIERLVTTPAQAGLGQAKKLGQQMLHTFGHERALDNIVGQQRQRILSEIETDLAGFTIGKTSDAEAAAMAEMEAVRQFAKIHGPKSQAEIQQISISGPADIFAVKQLDRIMDEYLGGPEPAPEIVAAMQLPQPRQASQ